MLGKVLEIQYIYEVKTALITGSTGLIGNESVRFLHDKGYKVIGIDNNLRKYFFGNNGDTTPVKNELLSQYKNYVHTKIDIRDLEELEKVFLEYGQDIEVIIHAAAQPSHDWAATEVFTDFGVNANGTLNILEMFRKYSASATFIYMSTNKVYGDFTNNFNFDEGELRWSLSKGSKYAANGFDESIPVDGSLHSLFGVSKLSGDLLVQEYGRYYSLKTTCLRGGCLSGPTHKGAELHGFLSYLVRCAVAGDKYIIFGYKGKQVRDNLHSADLVSAFWEIIKKPGIAQVYNVGGTVTSNISILEAIKYLESLGFKLNYEISEKNRIGDHIWWISDMSKFKDDYPNWNITKNSYNIIDDTIEAYLKLK
jgi:CDP-paratose 2-epimerase